MLPINGHPTSTAICYEVVFPSLMRDAVLQGSQLLTTVTNDGWYGTSSAPYQHFEMASMRAIEEGRYLARSANTGISGIVDPYGRIVQASAIFEQVGLVAEARLLTSRTDLLADRRRRRVCGDGAHGDRPGGGSPQGVLNDSEHRTEPELRSIARSPEPEETGDPVALDDELIRQHDDLNRRSLELRRHL